MQKAKESKYLRIGPGGMRCPCCFPKDKGMRKALMKQAKKICERDEKKLGLTYTEVNSNE